MIVAAESSGPGRNLAEFRFFSFYSTCVTSPPVSKVELVPVTVVLDPFYPERPVRPDM